MARTTIIITESAEQLAELLDLPKNAPYTQRLRMLALLKADPTRTLDAVAVELGVSGRSVYRWWGIYRKDGLAGLVGGAEAVAPKRGKMGERGLGELKKKLLAGELDGLRDIQEWVEKNYGVKYSLKGVSEVLRRMGMERRWVEDCKYGEGRAPVNDMSDVYDAIADLLNNMPVDTEVAVSIAKFRDILQRCLPEIDRVSVAVNIACQLANPEGYSPLTGITHSIDMSSKTMKFDVVSSNKTMFDDADRQINEYRKMGLPVDDYQPPPLNVYYFQSAYVGRIFLWKKNNSGPITDKTFSILKDLDKLIVLVMVNMVLRHVYMSPEENSFYSGFNRIDDECELTARERNVLVYRLCGCSYKEIAGRLGVTEDRIKKIVRSVHEKTETRSHIELVAKYFTPKLSLLNNTK